MRALAFLGFVLLCLTRSAQAGATYETYREIFTQMCWSVLQPERSVLKPEPRPNRLSLADCQRLAEAEATKIAADLESAAVDWKSTPEREFDVCMQLHEANQGQRVTDGFCRLTEQEEQESWKINLDRFRELRLREGEHGEDPETARAYLLEILPLGTSMSSAKETLSESGFYCRPDGDEAKVTCSKGAGYYTFARSRGLTICGGDWIVELGPLGAARMETLAANWIGACL